MTMIDSLGSSVFGFLSSLDNWHKALLVTNVLLLLLSHWIVAKLTHLETNSKSFSVRLAIFRGINVLLIILVILGAYFLGSEELPWMSRLVAGLMIAYAAFLASQLATYMIRIRYGKVRTIHGQKLTVETYSSRLLSLVVSGVIVVVAVLVIVQVMGASSLLQAGGALGVIGVMLALTQAAWAPDIIGGLIILNSGLVEEGDVISLDDDRRILVEVYKTKLFHTELLDLAKNHRVMRPNSALRSGTVHNLSKFASARGLRESLSFMIGYDVPSTRVKALFENVKDKAELSNDIAVEIQHSFEVSVTATGDDAVEWTLYYYTKSISRVLRTRQQLLELVLEESLSEGISLATPKLIVLDRPAPV